MEVLKSFGRRSFLKMASLATAVTATSAFANTEKVLRDATQEEVKNPFPGSKLIKTICMHVQWLCYYFRRGKSTNY
jgi:formate dehydrogenase major subunit